MNNHSHYLSHSWFIQIPELLVNSFYKDSVLIWIESWAVKWDRWVFIQVLAFHNCKNSVFETFRCVAVTESGEGCFYVFKNVGLYVSKQPTEVCWGVEKISRSWGVQMRVCGHIRFIVLDHYLERSFKVAQSGFWYLSINVCQVLLLFLYGPVFFLNPFLWSLILKTVRINFLDKIRQKDNRLNSKDSRYVRVNS